MNWNRQYIQSNAPNIRESAANKQSALAWKTVNEISGRKSKLVKASRLKSTFSKVLSNTPNVSYNEIEKNCEFISLIKLGNSRSKKLDKKKQK